MAEGTRALTFTALQKKNCISINKGTQKRVSSTCRYVKVSDIFSQAEMKSILST